MFDLHAHSNLSDGVDSPAKLLEMVDGQLSVFSICDHDTLAAYEALPTPTSVRILPGIEISCHHEEIGVHLLGYFPRGLSDSLRSRVRELEEDRHARVRSGVHRLREEGLALRWADLDAEVGDGVPSRSHVARLMVRMGFARSHQVIFDRYLVDKFPKPAISAPEAVAFVTEEGGVPIWAHPYPRVLDNYLDGLIASGLQGIEVFIPRRRKPETRQLLELAREKNLLVTGGSDYHGVNPRLPLGKFTVEDKWLPEVLGG